MQSCIIVAPINRVALRNRLTTFLGIGADNFSLRWPDDSGDWTYCHFTIMEPVEPAVITGHTGLTRVRVHNVTAPGTLNLNRVNVFLSEELWGAEHWALVQEQMVLAMADIPAPTSEDDED